MFKIGDFSKFTRVSVKTLRHYDELGLLKPCRVDPFTNYRYYSADQLPKLHRILALKDLGFSLEQIDHLVAQELPLDELRGMFRLKRAEIEQRLRAEQEKLSRLETHLALLERSSREPSAVVVRAVASQWVAGLRAPWAEDDGDAAARFKLVETFAARRRVRAPLPPLMVYYDQEEDDQEPVQEGAQDVEVAVPLTAAVPGQDRVQVHELPGHSAMACLIHTGGYERLGQSLGQLLGWIEANRFAIAGPMREVYLRFCADQEGYVLLDGFLTDRDDQFVTELQVPVAKEQFRND
jgi:DNA-binding transcriptional MerR regulator/effector-binding domain-containing protein